MFRNSIHLPSQTKTNSTMAPFDHYSLLHGLDSDDSGALRRVMNGVLRRLASCPQDHPLYVNALDDVEKQIVDRIIDETADNVLVRNAAIRFAAAHANSESDIARFSLELNIVVRPGILGPANLRNADAVQIAEATFDNFAKYGPAVATSSSAVIYHTVLSDPHGPKLRGGSDNGEEDVKVESENEKKKSKRKTTKVRFSNS